MARRRRRRSRKKKDVIQGKRRTSSAGANFLSFIFGMATTVMLVLWGYTAINSDYAQADIAPSDTKVKKEDLLGENYDEIDALMYSDNVAEVSAKLMDLNDWPRTAELPVRVSANRDREKVAKKLLRMNGLRETDRVFAIESLIEALSAIYGLDLFYNLHDNQIGDQLKQVAEQHAKDTSAQVVRSADLALLKYNAFEYVKYRKDELYQPLEDSLLKVLAEYPDDIYSISNVRLIFKSLTRLHPDVCVKLTNLLVKSRSEYAGTKTDQLIADLADAAILLKTRYATMFENRWVNGKAGREQLLRTSLDLVANNAAGRSVIEQVDRVAQWFEQQDKLDQARDIYQAMADATRPNDQIATETSRRLGQNGLTRCDALGQPIVYSGVDIKGQPFSSGRFQGKIVAIVFWSLNNSDSQQELIQLHQEKRQYSSLPAEIIAVCIDERPGSDFGNLAGQLNRFRSCDPANYATEGIPFTKQIPITQVPHVVLVDQQGIISDTNVPGDNLRSHIEHLATRR
jgi:hypothetical protein